MSVLSVLNLLRNFLDFDDPHHHLRSSRVDDLFNDLFQDSFHRNAVYNFDFNECSCWTRWITSTISSCLLNLWSWHVNDLLHHCPILHALHDGQLRRFPPSLGHGFPCSLHCTSSTSVSSIIVSESSSASFSSIVTCSATMFVGRPVFWTVWCVRHFALWAVVVGHPWPPFLPGPSVPWVSLPGPTGVPSDAQAGWHREQSANPCGCAVLVVVVTCCGHRAYTRSSSTICTVNF